MSVAESDDLGDLIADTARGVFAEIGLMGNTAARQAGESVRWFDQGWDILAQSGFLQAMRGEEAGGVGIAAASSIIRLGGAAALGLPLVEAMAADWLLASAGLPPAEHPTVFVPVPLEFAKTAEGICVRGTVESVAWARACDLVGLGLLDGQAGIVKIARDDVTVAERLNMADEPRDRITVDVKVDANAIASLPAGFDPDTPQRLGAVLRAGQIAGAAQAAVEMTAGYACDRQQFGRALSRFQAIQQLLATMAGEAAAAGVAADMAIDALGSGLPMEKVASAKIRAGEAAGKIAAAAHQVHGAIGFTREHSLQLLSRRLWSWRDEFGTEADWSIMLGRSLAAQPRGLWPAITDFFR